MNGTSSALLFQWHLLCLAWTLHRFGNIFLNLIFIDLPSLGKMLTVSDSTTGFPAKWRLRNERRNSILMTRRYPDLASASDWLKKFPTRHDQSESLARSGWWRVNSSFLRSCLRRHLAGKPVVGSPNVGCFLRLLLV